LLAISAEVEISPRHLQRVKGSEKFWNGDGNAEAMLELCAGWLNDEEAFVDRIRERPGHPYARPRRDEQPSIAA
jgi:hypothetical protein